MASLPLVNLKAATVIKHEHGMSEIVAACPFAPANDPLSFESTSDSSRLSMRQNCIDVSQIDYHASIMAGNSN